jgi:hypothetical protein
MSQEKVEVVRRMQAARVRGEYAASIEALDPTSSCGLTQRPTPTPEP